MDAVGDSVTIAGTAEADYLGKFPIRVINGADYTFRIPPPKPTAAGPVTPANPLMRANRATQADGCTRLQYNSPFFAIFFNPSVTADCATHNLHVDDIIFVNKLGNENLGVSEYFGEAKITAVPDNDHFTYELLTPARTEPATADLTPSGLRLYCGAYHLVELRTVRRDILDRLVALGSLTGMFTWQGDSGSMYITPAGRVVGLHAIGYWVNDPDFNTVIEPQGTAWGEMYAISGGYGIDYILNYVNDLIQTPFSTPNDNHVTVCRQADLPGLPPNDLGCVAGTECVQPWCTGVNPACTIRPGI